MSVAMNETERPAVSRPSLKDSIMRCLRSVNNRIQMVFFQVIQPNRIYYYGFYYGTNNPVILAFKNILRPKRFLTKFIYGQVIPLPAIISKGDPLPKFTPSEETLRIALQFKEDGVVVVPGMFRGIANHLTAQRNHGMEQFKPSEGYQDGQYLRKFDQETFLYMVDETILQIFALYYGCQPYLRAGLSISLAYPSADMKPTRESAPSQNNLQTGWHYDTPNLVQVAVLLNDVTENDTHMQILKGQHRVHRVNLGQYDYNYSDEYVRDHCEIVQCVGPKGTAYFFEPNAPHRLFIVKNSPRYMAKTEFMPGNHILPVKHPEIDYKITVEGGLNLERLSPLQKNALRYIV